MFIVIDDYYIDNLVSMMKGYWGILGIVPTILVDYP
jgi:hypothetical protein